MANKARRIYDVFDLSPGNLTVNEIQLESWGSTIIVDCTYRYPPVEKSFKLIFEDCRGIEWIVQRTGAQMADATTAQLLAHDLGQPDYARPARMATTLAEVILTYKRLKIEKDW